MSQLVTEAVEAAGTAVAKSGGVFLIDLITPGWGSSGYYSSEVLEAAATDRIFPAGTQMFVNHQTAQERNDRPEGDLKDLAAVLIEDAVWNPTGGEEGNGSLQAPARVFGHWREPLADMKEAIGTSIRAAADVEFGEAEGRKGRIVGRLVESISVDFVTRAGRGGRIVEVLEAATVQEARNIGQWVESRIHRDFTILADDMAGDGRLTREERISLSNAIGDALAAFVTRLEADQPQLYSRDLWDDPVDTVASAIEGRGAVQSVLDLLLEAAPLSVDTVRGREVTAWVNEAAPKLGATHVPANPAGRNNQESKEDTMAEIQIEESVVTDLREKAGRVTTLESERDTAIQERDEARNELAEARTEARESKIAKIIAEADAEFTGLEVEGLTAKAAKHVDESGVLDEEAFTKAVAESVAERAVAGGAGSVRGNGPRSTTNVPEVSEADLDAAGDSIFGSVKEA